MGKIFGGFLLIFLEFNLTLGNCTVGLLPDFIGYLCILSGLVELAEDGPSFKKARPFAILMSVYSAIVYILDFLGKTVGFWWLSVITTVFSLYVSYLIVKGVVEIEKKYHANLSSKALNVTWTVMAMLQTASFLALWIPAAGLLVVAGCVAGIVFMIMFFQSCKVYNTIPEK